MTISITQGLKTQQKVEEQLNSGKKVAMTQVKIHQEDLLDEKVVALAKEKKLISEEDEQNCRKQLKKL